MTPTHPFPEVVQSDLKAVRDFLTWPQETSDRPTRDDVSKEEGVPVRMGIARARMRKK